MEKTYLAVFTAKQTEIVKNMGIEEVPQIAPTSKNQSRKDQIRIQTSNRFSIDRTDSKLISTPPGHSIFPLLLKNNQQFISITIRPSKKKKNINPFSPLPLALGSHHSIDSPVPIKEGLFRRNALLLCTEIDSECVRFA